MASTTTVKTLELCQIAPSAASPASATELSIPLTFFDTLWFKFPPVEYLFLYKLTESTPSHFHSFILPKLKHSLSLTLLHYLPLAGNLTWPPHSAKPVISYVPNDSVSLKIAESNADFNRVSGYKTRQAIELHPYMPELPVSESKAPTIALQITLFPDQGFCIGISAHHVIQDGKSIAMFVKSWAYLCKLSGNEKNPRLLPELTPFLDRTIVQDPEELDMVYLNARLRMRLPGSNPDHNPRSLKPFALPEAQPNLVRATFELSREDINRLRERTLSQYKGPNQIRKPANLSSFVVSFAHALVCLVKAKRLESDRKVYVGFVADRRAHLDPPLPENYFGGCVTTHHILTEAQAFMAENGLAFIATKLSEVVEGISQKGVVEGEKEKLTVELPLPRETIGFGGSTRSGYYDPDFGWGRPQKMEIVSIDRTGAICILERRNGNGGVEVTLALMEDEMNVFESLFVNGKATTIAAKL